MRAAGRSGEQSQPAVPLFSRFPELNESIPYAPLACRPSPVSRLDHLSKAIGGGEVWLKNDGLYGTAYGGNKPRKLEFILADALQKGARTIMTTGALATNHGLATAIYGGRVGLHVVLALAYQQPDEDVARQLCRMQEAGAEMHNTHSFALTGLLAPYLVARQWARDKRRPYILGPGGSNALGALGFVNAGLELAEQVRAGELPEPGTIVIALGSGGTAAGLALGVRLGGLRSRLIGVVITRAPTAWGPVSRRLANSAGRLLERRGVLRAEIPTIGAGDLAADRRWLGPGYGRASAEGEEARGLLLDTEGVRADPTYTAKTVAALIALAREASVPGPLLYWHTFDALSDTSHQFGRADFLRLPPSFHRFCPAAWSQP